MLTEVGLIITQQVNHMKKMTFFLANLILTFSISANASTYNDYVFFGDSLTDTGNQGCYTNTVNFGSQSGCGTWANFLHWNKFNSQATPSSQGGVNYAYAGSTSTDALNQIQTYLQQHGGQADPNTYYFILTGANDIMITGLPYMAAVQKDITSGNFQKAIQDVATVFFNIDHWMEDKGGPIYNQVQAVKTLQSKGAKHVMMIDLENPTYVPFVQSYMTSAGSTLSSFCQSLPTQQLKDNCNGAIQALAATPDIFMRNYNGTLEADLHQDQTTAAVKMFSMYSFNQNLLNNGYKPCSDKSGTSNCLFWDDRHPSVSAHQKMAEAIQAIIDQSSSEA